MLVKGGPASFLHGWDCISSSEPFRTHRCMVSTSFCALEFSAHRGSVLWKRHFILRAVLLLSANGAYGVQWPRLYRKGCHEILPFPEWCSHCRLWGRHGNLRRKGRSPVPRYNTLRPRQNGRHFADDTFKRIFLNENFRISIKISMKFVPKGSIYATSASVQIMAWRRPGDKSLSESTHLFVSRPQWDNTPILTTP